MISGIAVAFVTVRIRDWDGKKTMKRLIILLAAFLAQISTSMAQDLTIATITRPPFSMVENGTDTGFSVDLWNAIAADLGANFNFRRVENFGEMLNLVEDGSVDAAIANISITSAREAHMDFSQPIFESGLQIMIKSDYQSDLSILRAVFSRDVLTAIVLAFLLLLGGGMLMWRFERNAQPYFDKPVKEAMFPAFWWALNLIVNGGFEERVPRTAFGRIFGVFLVISSLFIVSIFVAKITAVLTVDAIQNSVESLNDLERLHVASIDGSTASDFLEDRNIQFMAFSDLTEMYAAFEAGEEDAIVFDAPVLAYYANRSNGRAKVVGPVFQRENYGVALPTGSVLAEQINQSLLELRENGTYDALYRKWFGGGAR